MQFAAILAGGSGVRMGNPNKPKQFFYLGDKPILVHTLEKFCAAGSFDGVLVLTPANLGSADEGHHRQALPAVRRGGQRHRWRRRAQRHHHERHPLLRGRVPGGRRFHHRHPRCRCAPSSPCASSKTTSPPPSLMAPAIPSCPPPTPSLRVSMANSFPPSRIAACSTKARRPRASICVNCAKRWSRSLLKRAPFSLMPARPSFCVARRWP